MARRDQADSDFADREWLTIGQGLQLTAGRIAITHRHYCQRFRRGEDVCVVGTRVVGVPVCDDGARDRAKRVDVKIAGLAVEPLASG